ncbi:MAG: hypothetical protein ACREJD_16070 [Phycisphaerales bacterium]
MPLALAAAAACFSASCGVFGGGLTRGTTLASAETGFVLNMTPRYQAYLSSDINTADFFLSDLPPDAFADGADLSQFAGSLVQIHMFLAPKSGSTPIAFSATSATVRQIVFANGQMGMYSGGGFLLPSGTAGDSTFGGTIHSASMRLTARTPGFADKLGSSEFASGLSVPKDVSRAKRMSLLVERAYAQMPIRNLPKILGQDQNDATNDIEHHLDADTSESTPDSKIEKPTPTNPGNQPTPPSTPPPGPL